MKEDGYFKLDFIMALTLTVILLVGIAIIVHALPKKVEPIEPAEEQTEQQTQPMLYGTVQYVKDVPKEEWVVGGIDFKPVDCELDAEVQEFIYYLSYGYNIDFHFVMGIIEQESCYKADVISKTNDYGLMQINTYNHKWLSEALGITDYLDPYQNVIAGVYICYTLFQEYGNDTSKVLMAYNLGPAGAAKLWEQGIYETQYSKRVQERIERMKSEV